MLHITRLLLPALIPSWRFFDTIEPAPRLEFRTLKNTDGFDHNGPDPEWKEFRPRPARLSAWRLFTRMLWNPSWNEFLFLTSCAERLLESGSAHSCQEILNRIKSELSRDAGNKAEYLQFRLTLVSRQGTKLQKEVAFVSPAYPYGQSIPS